jgi:hypothetical protein
MTEIEAAKEFWKDHVARLTMGKPLVDPYQAGLAQGKKHQFDDLSLMVYALERLVRDVNIDSDIQQRAQKLLHEIRSKNET